MSFENMLADRINRSVPVEQELLDIANGKRPLPTPEDCRRMAMVLGVPTNMQRAGGPPECPEPTWMTPAPRALTFKTFRIANVVRCARWHPEGIGGWSTSDWLVAVTGELGELASLIKMQNRERDGLPGNKFSPTKEMIANEIADVFIYLDLFAAAVGVDLGAAVVSKFNEVSERVGFPDRLRT